MHPRRITKLSHLSDEQKAARRKEQARAWRQRNKDRLRAYRNEYYRRLRRLANQRGMDPPLTPIS